MTADALRPAVGNAEDALRAFLSTLLGAEPDLTAGAPAEAETAEPLAFALVARPAEGAPFALALGEGWGDVLAEAMLGGPVDPAEAADLLQEVVAQGLGAVRTALAAAGLAVPEAPLKAADADALAELPSPLWRVPFQMRHGGRTLKGVVYLPPVELPRAAPEEAASEKPAPEQAGAPKAPAPEISRPSFQELGPERIDGGDGAPGGLALLADVELEVTVELGRRRIPLSDVLRLTTGSVIELENLVGQPLEVYANGRLIAEGEAVVIDEQFGVRITSLAAQRRRHRSFL